MMLGYICSPCYANELKQLWQDQWCMQKDNIISPADFIRSCQSAANLSLDILFIDLSCTDDHAIIRGLRMFRIRRNTRIILLAPNRSPGDQTMAALVSLGIYDIIHPPGEDEWSDETEALFKEEMIQQIDKNPSFADVSRWHFDASFDDDLPEVTEPKPKKPMEIKRIVPDPLEDMELDIPNMEPRKQIIYKERLIGTGIIACSGSGRRTGTTFSAIRIATYLAQSGYTVACLERVDSQVNPYCFHFLKTEQPSKIEGGFHHTGVDFFPQVTNERYYQILGGNYQYLVLDLGFIHQSHSDIIQADVHIVNTGASEWDFKNLLHTLDQYISWGWNRSWNILVNYSNQQNFTQINKALTKREKKDLGVEFHLNHFSPSPFELPESDIYYPFLERILPKESSKKKFKFF